MTKRSKDKAARHIRLYHWLLRSEAWQSLSANARAIYIEMATRYNGSNSGQIPFSVRDAANRAHIGKNAADAALTLLQARGFIVATRRGGFNVKTKIATEWRLTEFSCDVDHSFATKDFMRWYPWRDRGRPRNASHGPATGTRIVYQGGAAPDRGDVGWQGPDTERPGPSLRASLASTPRNGGRHFPMGERGVHFRIARRGHRATCRRAGAAKPHAPRGRSDVSACDVERRRA